MSTSFGSRGATPHNLPSPLSFSVKIDEEQHNLGGNAWSSNLLRQIIRYPAISEYFFSDLGIIADLDILDFSSMLSEEDSSSNYGSEAMLRHIEHFGTTYTEDSNIWDPVINIKVNLCLCVRVSFWICFSRSLSRSLSFSQAVWLLFISYVTMPLSYFTLTQARQPTVLNTANSISSTSLPLYVLNIILSTGHQEDGLVVSHESLVTVREREWHLIWFMFIGSPTATAVNPFRFYISGQGQG